MDVGRGQMVDLPEAAASVLAADPAVARVQPASPTRLFVIAVAAGHTTIVATNATGGTIAQFEVTVHPNAPVGGPPPTADGAPAVSAANPAAAEEAIMQTVHGAQNIHVRLAGHTMIITGIVPSPAAAQAAVAIVRAYEGGDKTVVIDQMLVLSSIQVNVRVRFAEIDRTITRQLGFNWQAVAGKGGPIEFGIATGAATLSSSISTYTPLGVTVSGSSAPAQAGLGSTRWDVNSIVDALAADNLLTILAEPNLTAQSGETASFLAGGEFPVPVSATSSTQISIDFKQYGVSLSVVPTVLSTSRLNLRVRPEVSSLTTTGAISVPLAGGTLTIPALSVNRAETTIELGSGQSFAIAGLLKHSTSDQLTTLPGIGEIPVLGALFRSDAFQREETELVIIVTPYIVVPASSPSKLLTPTDGFKPPIDLDRMLFGRQLGAGSVSPQVAAAGAAAAAAKPAAAALPSLDAGFILR